MENQMHGRSPQPVTDAGSRVAALTPRRRDVLNGILAGSSNKMIAHSLGISPRTVEIHRAHLMRDLDARHVADVIRLALEAVDFNAQAPGRGPKVAHSKARRPVFDRRR
jgi:FixJ family two-component response regulator